MSTASCTAHLEAERQEILSYIQSRYNTVRLLKRRAPYQERRIQRRVTELLRLGWIEQVGLQTEQSVSLRIFRITEDGKRNVPSRR